jgi:hypothetical protein
MLPPPMMLDWARSLFADESVAGTTSEPAVFLVYEKLRQQLSAPVGVDGFQALASRALMLARSEAPGLSVVQVTTGGSLRGLGELESQTNPDQGGEAGVILIAHLLGLFLTFLGAATTRRLVQDVFPNPDAVVESSTSAPFQGIFQEATNLRSLCERLESLANEHPAIEDGLGSISGSIRNIATLLDVFAVVRNTSDEVRKSNPTEQLTNYVM